MVFQFRSEREDNIADIELVIKIPEEMWERVKEGYVPLGINKYLRNSAPLPKGHGELVDRNGINERFDSIYNDAINCSNQPSDKYLLDKLSMCLDTALPIIEADKEI